MKIINPKVILFLLLVFTLPAIFASSCKNDSTNPVDPNSVGFTKVGSYNSSGTANNVYVKNINDTNVAFLADGNSGIQILNVSNLSNPILISGYNTLGYSYDVKTVRINGSNYAIVADGVNDIVILDISNLSSPVEKFTVEFVDDAIISIEIDTVNNKALAGSNGGFLYVIELNLLPNNLSVIGTYVGYDKIEGIYVKGGICYLAERGFGMEILNISDYTFPVSLSSANTPGEAHDVFAFNNTAYVADGSAGVSIFDVSDNQNPLYLGSVKGVDAVVDICNTLSRLYTAEGTYGVESVNISSPVSPSVIGSYKTSSAPFGVFSTGNTLFVANGLDGLTILSVNN